MLPMLHLSKPCQSISWILSQTGSSSHRLGSLCALAEHGHCLDCTYLLDTPGLGVHARSTHVWIPNVHNYWMLRRERYGPHILYWLRCPDCIPVSFQRWSWWIAGGASQGSGWLVDWVLLDWSNWVCWVCCPLRFFGTPLHWHGNKQMIKGNPTGNTTGKYWISGSKSLVRSLAFPEMGVAQVHQKWIKWFILFLVPLIIQGNEIPI
jgi:hypothetical protein